VSQPLRSSSSTEPPQPSPHTLTGPHPQFLSRTEKSKGADSQQTPFLTRDSEVASADAGPPPSTVPWSPDAPLPARFAEYELLGEIARGGMGVVYKARQLGLNRTVALKMILPDHLRADTAVRRFYREARAAAALDHPNIVPIYEVGEHQGYHFYTMAFIDGHCLKGLIRTNGLPTPQQAASILLAVAEGVGFAHDHGIIHRDLKPENVLLDGRGRVRVADFGLAKQTASDPSLTRAGQVMGTPSYMAPEQAEGLDDKVGPCSDVYGLGGILYFLLTGHAPFEGHSATQVLRQVFMGAPVPPHQYNSQVCPQLEAICLKCLEKDPAQRYPSAAALAECLRPLAGQAPGTTPPAAVPSVPDTTSDSQATSLGFSARPAPAQRPRWIRVALTTAILLGLAIGAWLIASRWRGGAARTAEEQAAPEGASAGKPVVLPKKLGNDFGLEVTMIGGQAGQQDTLLLTAGDLVRFRVKVDTRSYVGVWTVEADGTIRQLFPNPDEVDHLFEPGKERVVPQVGARAVPSQGVDRIWVAASTKSWNPDDGQHLGPLELFRQERDHTRGMLLNSNLRLAEQVLKYVVKPRP
jgi:serine/threonine protein kinase